MPKLGAYILPKSTQLESQHAELCREGDDQDDLMKLKFSNRAGCGSSLYKQRAALTVHLGGICFLALFQG